MAPIRIVQEKKATVVPRKWEIWRFARGGQATLVAVFNGTAVQALVAWQRAVDVYPGERIRLQLDNNFGGPSL